MEDKILKAEIRKDTGKRYSKMIRNQEKTPGVFYSKDSGSIPFECLTNLSVRDHVCQTPAGQIPDKKRIERG